eukprot:Clim_evm120s210 gene=Clim_evmTU120s210
MSLSTAAWVSFINAGMLMLCAGSPYSFSVYSHQLKELTGISESQLELLGSMGHAGLYFGVTMGLLYDYTGPAVTGFLGGILLLLGYGGVGGLLYTESHINREDLQAYPTEQTTAVPKTIVASMSVLFFVIGQGSKAFYITSMVTCVKSAPQSLYGRVSGVLAAAVALSGALCTAIYWIWFDKALSSYLIFLGVFFFTMGCIGARTIRVEKIDESKAVVAHEMTRKSDFSSVVDRSEAVEMVEISPLRQRDHKVFHDEDTGKPSFDVTDVPGTTASEASGDLGEPSTPPLLSNGIDNSPTLRPANAHTNRNSSPFAQVLQDNEFEVFTSTGFDGHDHGNELENGAVDTRLADGDPTTSYQGPKADVTPVQLIRNPVFIALWLIILADDGAAVMYVNSLGTVVHSSNEDELWPVGTYVIIFSVTSAVGRIIWGTLSDFLSHIINREGFLALSVMVMAFTHLGIFLFPGNIFLATLFSGVSFGGLFSLGPAIIAENFGLEHFGTNWGITTLAPVLGSIVFGQIFGAIYDAQLGEDDDYDETAHCKGSKCFRYAFLVSGIVNLVGGISCFMLSKYLDKMRGRKRMATQGSTILYQRLEEEDG